MKHLLMAMFASLLASPSALAVTEAELEQTLSRLMTTLPGEFDSAAQMQAEEATNTPTDMIHRNVYRSFIRISAPAVGENLLVSTVRYGGRDGRFDNGEFQVWALTIDEDKGGVKMAPRRFKSPDDYIENDRNPAASTQLQPTELIPAHGGASCPIHWYPNGDALRGITDPPCESLSETMGIVLKWDWAYSLDDNGMWLNFAGRDESGAVVNGRTDQMPWRLDKIN